ncbi:MAG: large-conductance mechanosensitive channel protein MscL [Pseudomonadota bacterium]
MLNEFKEFAMKGNLVDMAVGFILGGAFGTVVKSLVSDIIMPPVGLLLGGVDFSAIKTELKPAELAADGSVATEAVTVNWGVFLDNVIAFLIVAWVMFMIIKAMNAAKKKEEEAPAEPEAPPAQEVLLGEIRDLLAKSS